MMIWCERSGGLFRKNLHRLDAIGEALYAGSYLIQAGFDSRVLADATELSHFRSVY